MGKKDLEEVVIYNNLIFIVSINRLGQHCRKGHKGIGQKENQTDDQYFLSLEPFQEGTPEKLIAEAEVVVGKQKAIAEVDPQNGAALFEQEVEFFGIGPEAIPHRRGSTSKWQSTARLLNMFLVSSASKVSER